MEDWGLLAWLRFLLVFIIWKIRQFLAWRQFLSGSCHLEDWWILAQQRFLQVLVKWKIEESWLGWDSYWFLSFGRLGSQRCYLFLSYGRLGLQRCNLFLSYGGLENSWLGDNFYLVLVTWTIEESWLSRDSYWFLSYGRLRNLGLAKILAGFCPMQDWGILAWLRFLLVLVKWNSLLAQLSQIS